MEELDWLGRLHEDMLSQGGVEELDWLGESPDLNTIGMNLSDECVPGLLIQHQNPTSLMLLWLNEHKTLLYSHTPNSIGKPQQKIGTYCESKGGLNL